LGTKVCVEGAGEMDGIWTVEDRMNKRWKNRIDFLVDYDIKRGKWNNVKIYLVDELNQKQ
jgi:3D (Asp-Asp-Asp) domain-containing protein